MATVTRELEWYNYLSNSNRVNITVEDDECCWLCRRNEITLSLCPRSCGIHCYTTNSAVNNRFIPSEQQFETLWYTRSPKKYTDSESGEEQGWLCWACATN